MEPATRNTDAHVGVWWGVSRWAGGERTPPLQAPVEGGWGVSSVEQQRPPVDAEGMTSGVCCVQVDANQWGI